MATIPDAAKELSLVGKVEMRIALADSDDKLAATLKTYLPPLLLKLASPHASVRNKVISICSHVNTRIQPETVGLPVQALVEQFRAQIHVPLIRHFDLLYVHKGIPRLTPQEKNDLFPVVIKGISTTASTSAEHASQVLHLVFQLIEYFKFPSRGTEQDNLLRETLAISDDDAAYLASWFGKLILFAPVKPTSNQQAKCPGLTADEYAFLALQNSDTAWARAGSSGLSLAQTKIRVAKLLASGLFTDKNRFLPALFASADPSSDVSDTGDDMLKRVLPNTDLEDAQTVKELFEYFFGTAVRPKVRSPLRLKILGLLSKSTSSTTFTNEIIQIANECLAPPELEPQQLPALNGMQMDLDTILNQSRSGKVGLELTKLRSALFSYINFVARHGKQESLHAIAPRVLGRLRDFIEEQGWPKAAAITSQQELQSRGYAYEVIGLLAKAGPAELVVEPNLEILRWLFRSLADDRSSNTLIVSIEEALSSLLIAFSRSPLEPGTAEALESLLLSQMLESEMAAKDADSLRRSTRYVSVRFANRCLPFSSVTARAIDLLAAGSGSKDRAEVVEEGERGLSPYWYRMLNGSLADTEDVQFPDFSLLVNFVFYELNDGGRRLRPEDDLAHVIQQFRAMRPTIFVHAITFCRLVLVHEILSKSGQDLVAVDSEWGRKLNIMIETDEKTRDRLRIGLQSIGTDVSSSPYSTHQIELLLRAFLAPLTSKDQVAAASKTVEDTGLAVELLAILPDAMIGRVAAECISLVPSIASNNHVLRSDAAHVFGILATHPSVDRSQVKIILDDMATKINGYKNVTGVVSNTINGYTLASSFFYSRYHLRTGVGLARDEKFQAFFGLVLGMINEVNDQDLKKAAINSLAELSIYQVITPESFADIVSLREIVDNIYGVAKSGNEAAALALGKLSTILPEPEALDLNGATEQPTTPSELLAYIWTRLHKLHEIRTAESHFAVGEAISLLSAAWSSSALSTAIDLSSCATSQPSVPPRAKTLDAVLDRILADCSTTKPSLRKASVIWLLCLVQFCGHLAQVQVRLPQCQTAFKRCLVDRDDLVQETASRGLGLVYERGSPSLRSELVRDLMSSFSSDQRASSGLAGTVGQDTQLFEPGAFPTATNSSGGTSESLTTYRDLMNLASETGDPRLVYRFMSIAASNAIWSSRAAFGKFGLGNLLSGDGEGNGVHDYLQENPKVYASLYRYRFDPNEGVQRSMNGIWNSLVKDSNKTIDAHFDAIIEDVLKNIFGQEWRTRQACCAGLADLVQGRALERYEPYLERIWHACFRVLDDMKDSVRRAAARLARTLTGIVTRTLEADGGGGGANVAKTLGHLLPFLLSPSGIESSAMEVRLFAVKSLLAIIKKAGGRALRPFIPELVERLLGLIGSLEHEGVEYARLNAKRINMTEQQIDDIRLMGVSDSPVMESIERCLDHVDEATMAALQPRLEAAVRASIALPSKVACSRVLVSLSTRRSFVFAPHADVFLRLLEKVVLDRNDTVASSYAAAAGYVARAASDKQLLHLVGFARGLYFDSAGDRETGVPRRAVTAGDIVKSLGKHSGDRFKAAAAELAPFVYIAKHDSHETVRELFQDTWNDNVGGSRSVSLYLREIVALASQYLDSPQWAVKQTVSRAIADATAAVATIGMDEVSGGLIWPQLEKALAAKTWDGKEVVSTALVRFVEAGGKYWQSREDVREAIKKIATREAKRQNPAYQKSAVANLGKVAAGMQDATFGRATLGVIESIADANLDKLRGDADAMDTDAQADDRKTWLQVVSGCMQAANDAMEGFKGDGEGVEEVVGLLERTGGMWAGGGGRLQGQSGLVGTARALVAKVDEAARGQDGVGREEMGRRLEALWKWCV